MGMGGGQDMQTRVEMQGVGELVAGGGEGVWVHMQNVRHRVSPLAPQLTSSAT